MEAGGWQFTGEMGSQPVDPLYGFKTLKELYFKANPNYSGRFTVPVLWDKKGETVVNNESSEIIRMFYSEFDDLLPEDRREASKPGGGLYPQNLSKEIDEMNDWVYSTVNNGVYKVGFSTAQEVYETNIRLLFESLDRLEDILAKSQGPFVLGDYLTEADVRLYTSIARFDTAYVPVMLCNLKTIRRDYPHLHLWLRRLYWDAPTVATQTKGAFKQTTEPFVQWYREGYARARRSVVMQNQGPLIVPLGPVVPIEQLAEEER